jgi:hypothetical protein
MPFVSGPVLTYVGAGQYKTVGPTEYVGERDIIHIPSDFPTDLASVPRIFWALLPPHGAYERAAVLHDAFCVWLAKGTSPVSARDADAIFRRVMREAGVGFVGRWVLWTGVRYGALFSRNGARRAGWARDAPRVFLVTAVVGFVTGALVYGADRAAHALAHLI